MALGQRGNADSLPLLRRESRAEISQTKKVTDRRIKSTEDEIAETIVIRGEGTTTAGTLTVVLAERALENGEVYDVECKVKGQERGASNRGSYFIEGCVYCDGGAATIQGQSTTAYESNAAWEWILTVQRNIVRLRGGDPGGGMIDWTGEMRLRRR